MAACPDDEVPPLPRVEQCHHPSDSDSSENMMNSVANSSASTEDEPSSFIGDITATMEDVDLESHSAEVPDDEEDADNSVTVGLSQVTLFPSNKLQQDDAQWDLPGSECFLLSTFGMCLDEDQMIQLALAYQQQQHRGKKRKPYVPPPVTWSQPVLIVPPETEMPQVAEDASTSTGGSTTNNSSARKHVKFQTDGDGSDDTDKDKHSQHQHQQHNHKTIISSTTRSSTNSGGLMRIILLHGRVARALGIRHGDCVTVQLSGQAKRQIVKASVDDHASFNVVMEAEWNDVVSSSYLKTAHPRRELVDSNSPVLRSVKLAVEPEADDEETSHARFHLTPSDKCRQGVLYFEGAMGVLDPAQGLIAGIGFCIYSCKDYSSVDDEDDIDDDSSSSNDLVARRLKRRMPVNRTELVSSYRYLGRPFCPNHAEYSALIEGLEWLFRFQFEKVHIVGAPEVVAALRYRCKRPVKKYSKRKGVYSNHVDTMEEDYGDVSLLKIPQLRKANTIAQDMILKAKDRGMEINYIAALDDESWEAGDLAEKAIDVGRNETQVLWENILEAKRIDPPLQMRPSLTYSIDENSISPPPPITFPEKVENLLDSDDSWSLLKGEEVLDEEFELPADLESSCRAGRNDDKSEDTEVTGHHSRLAETTSGAGSTTDDGYHEQDDDGTEEPPKKVVEKKKETPPEEAKRRQIDESKQVDNNPNWQDLQHLERGSARWRHLAKALKHKRLSNRHSSGQSVTSQMSQASIDDNKSTWMMEPTSVTKMPDLTIKIMQKKTPKPTPPPEPTMPVFEAPFDSDSIHHRIYDDYRIGEEKIDYYYDGDDDETKSQEPFYEEIKPELPRGKESASSSNHNNSYTSSSNMCFFLDLGFLQGPQVIADEMARIFVGEPRRSEDTQEQEEEEEEAKVATPPRLSSSNESTPVATPNNLEPPSVMRHDTRNLFHPKHKEDPMVLPTASPPRFRRQYAYV